MKVIRARNVNDALPRGLAYLRESGLTRETRNGGAVVAPEPVTTVYEQPRERVLFSKLRDANPFFHLFEALWMLAGRHDLAFVEKFAKNMRSFSDDGETMWGAYGWRWRTFFDFDQLSWAVHRLRRLPNDRRVVVQMWAAGLDQERADAGGKDVPCNIAIHFRINDRGQLDMTVWNRSNDIIWGAYGANVVHMSILQEYVASAVGVEVGRYWQVSDDYHAYSDLFNKMLPLMSASGVAPDDMYLAGVSEPTPLMEQPESWQTWDQDLVMFLDEPGAVGFRNAFFRKVCVPMMMAHKAYSQGRGEARYADAVEILSQMPPYNDWRIACMNWIQTRWDKYKKARDDGPNHDEV
ncbi:thymidylate synthase [Alphaproteobacteria phage PhiJL001]|uniref:Thymidylate synthase n=1 Tax=Alphaproteobacteria phage PhiJL001 TaxID=2681607 RepID=Q5DN81_9CAUD|nr:thymidylate synthase [Alphaproteobacteria phage PhiJL001]AAT69500.1 thymidylate synthase [Alphaproteobacteria phage PhiJL001]